MTASTLPLLILAISAALALFGIACIVLAAHVANAHVRRPSSGPPYATGRSRAGDRFGGSE